MLDKVKLGILFTYVLTMHLGHSEKVPLACLLRDLLYIFEGDMKGFEVEPSKKS